jgi:heme oxygenase
MLEETTEATRQTDQARRRDRGPEGAMAQLRRETRAEHEAVEGLAYHRALMSHTLPARCVAAKLLCERELHRGIETALGRAEARWAEELRELVTARVPLIDADYRALRSAQSHSFDRTPFPARWPDPEARAMLVSREYARALVARTGERGDATLLGVLYVTEGSALGGALLGKHLHEGLGLEPGTLRSLNPYGREVKRQWGRFCAVVDGILGDDRDARCAAVDAARECFLHHADVLQALGACLRG